MSTSPGLCIQYLRCKIGVSLKISIVRRAEIVGKLARVVSVSVSVNVI